MNGKTIQKAAIMGVVVVVAGLTVSAGLRATNVGKVELPPDCKRWNEKHIMEISLFLTGFTAHLAGKWLGL